jgi:hypothetical protein
MVRVMVVDATFSNISVISWRIIILMAGNEKHEKKPPTAARHQQTLSHNVVFSTPHPRGIQTHLMGVSKPQSTTLKGSILTITPLMLFFDEGSLWS